MRWGGGDRWWRELGRGLPAAARGQLFSSPGSSVSGACLACHSLSMRCRMPDAWSNLSILLSKCSAGVGTGVWNHQTGCL